MTCAQVQLLLTEYMEKSLDSVRMKAVETHLLSCAGCRAETEDLMDCIRQVSDLPLMDPPIGFTQRVMAHVREMETKQALWQGLFSSFRVGMPIQATAVVLVAVLAVFLYQKESQIGGDGTSQVVSPKPSQPLFDAGSDAKIQQPTESPQNRADDGQQTESTGRAAQSPSAESPKNTVSSAGTAADQTGSRTKAPAVPAANSAGDVKDPFVRRGPIPAQEIATGMESLRPSDTFGIGPTLGGSLRPGFFLPERSLSPITEPNADAEFIVRRREAQRRDQGSAARSDTAHQSGETGIAPAIAKQTLATPPSPNSSMTVREIRWFAVPADQYEQFKKDLASEASIESEKASGASERKFALESNRELLIKVIIVSPAER